MKRQLTKWDKIFTQCDQQETQTYVCGESYVLEKHKSKLLILVWLAIIKSLQARNAGEGVDRKAPSYIVHVHCYTTVKNSINIL